MAPHTHYYALKGRDSIEKITLFFKPRDLSKNPSISYL